MNTLRHAYAKLLPNHFISNKAQKYLSTTAIKAFQKPERKSASPTISQEVFTFLNNTNLDLKTDWREIRQNLLSNSRNVTDKNIDALTLNYCLINKMYNVAFNYIDFLKDENIQINLATLGKYFKICHDLYYENKLTKEQSENIWSAYMELTITHQVLDSLTLENVIMALSVTDHWKECLKLMSNVKVTTVPSNGAYNAVVAAAFRNGDYQLGWDLFEEMLINNRIPSNITYTSYFTSCTDMNETEKIEKLKQFFDYLNAFDLRCSSSVKDFIIKAFSSLNFHLQESNISKSGTCNCCNKKLDKLTISQAEFNDLKKNFLEKVVIGKDIYRKTNPFEFNTFKKFIEIRDKFDVVVDGLNVAYTSGNHLPKQLALLVLSVIDHFINENKKVLVLGRKHMAKWYLWPRINQKATTFLTDNLSQDDPYLLYAALHSGINTKVISRDMMRSHLYLLKDHRHKRIFNRWLSENRYELQHVSQNGRVILKYPLSYNISAQKHGNLWHIPYEERNGNETVIKWLCVQKCK